MLAFGLSLIAISAVYVWAYFPQRPSRKAGQTHLGKLKSTPEGFSRATIAYDMVPRVNQLNLKGAKLKILGYDCSYINDPQKGAYFRDALKHWISEGAEILYILLEKDSLPRTIFDQLERIRQESGGKFSFLKYNSETATTEVEEIATRFERLHPTLITTQEGPCFWVEYDHPQNSSVAYNAKFVSPLAMKVRDELNEYRIYERQIEILSSHLTRPLQAT